MRKEYYPATLCQKFLEDFQIEPGMNPLEIKKIISQKNLILKEEADLVISAITLSGWAETKQAYQFKKDLVEELKTDVQMDFCLRDLALPFLSFFLDLQLCDEKLDGQKVLGAFVTVCLPPEEYICIVCPVKNQAGKVRLIKAAVQYTGNLTLTDAIKKICGDLDGDFELTQLVLQLMSYISSEKPDVCEKGSAFFLGYKKRPVKIRMWDVGYHATIEHRDPQSNNKKIQKDGTHQSPRAHMRRGHWHTYLYGKGKEKRKVVWVSEQKIGHGEFIHTVREIEKRN